MSGQDLISEHQLVSLPKASELLKQALNIYKRRFGTFLGIVAIPLFLSFVFLSLPLLIQKNIFLFFLFFFLGFLVTIFVHLWSQTALIYAIKDREEKIGIGEAYKRGLPKIIPYLWVSILSGFITLGGFFLFIIPGIIFAVWFSLAKFIVIAENVKGMNALLKSREYVKGMWGSVFWRLLFIILLVFLFSLTFVVILVLLKIPLELVKGISNFFFALFFIPLVTSYTFLIYEGLKAIKKEVTSSFAQGEKLKFIIVGLIGIILIFLIPIIIISSFGAAIKKARDAQREAMAAQIRAALEMYYLEFERYPASLDELVPQYLPRPLLDPLTKEPYQYHLQENGQNYKLCIQLESVKAQKCFNKLGSLGQ